MPHFPVQKGFSRASISLLLSIPRAWKFSFSLQDTSRRFFYLESTDCLRNLEGVKILKERSSEKISMWGLLSMCWSLWVLWNPEVPHGSHSHCNLLLSNHTHYKAWTNILQFLFLFVFSSNFPQTSCTTSPWESSELSGWFWQLPAQGALGRQCQQLLVAGEVSNCFEEVSVPQLHPCLLCSWLHTKRGKEKEKKNIKTQPHMQKKKVHPLYYFKCIDQLTAEELLTYWAGHMLKYFPELAPGTTLPTPSPLLPSHALPHHISSRGAQSLLWWGIPAAWGQVSIQIVLRNTVRYWSKHTHNPKPLCISVLETKIRISFCVCQRWLFLPWHPLLWKQISEFQSVTKAPAKTHSHEPAQETLSYLSLGWSSRNTRNVLDWTLLSLPRNSGVTALK